MIYIVIAFAFILVFIWLNQRQLMYHPDKHRPSLRQYTVNDVQEISLTTDDGLKLFAWYQPPSTKQLTVIFFHGNAGHLGGRMSLVNALIDRGYGALIMSYRGYAGNPGHPTEQGLYQDGRAAMRFLKQKQACTIIFGESLGTGVASQMALEFKIKGLVLQAPYTSMVDTAKYHYPYIFLKPWDKYQTIKKVDKISVPLLVIHGKQDRVVPFIQGQRVFKHVASQDKRLFSPHDRGHNDLWDEKFFHELFTFLDKINSDCNKATKKD